MVTNLKLEQERHNPQVFSQQHPPLHHTKSISAKKTDHYYLYVMVDMRMIQAGNFAVKHITVDLNNRAKKKKKGKREKHTKVAELGS